jgi:hypothetical protein
MRLTSLFLWTGVLAGAGCARPPGGQAPDTDPRTPPVPYAADSRNGAQGGSASAGTVSGKDDTAPPRGAPSARMPPPPHTQPQEPQEPQEAPRPDELPPAQHY